MDLIPGYREMKKNLIKSISEQDSFFQEQLDTKLYDIVARLSEHGFNSERFDRVEDYTKQVAIVPCSAKTGEGIPELLMVLIGLAQKYLEGSIRIKLGERAKGSVLEVKESPGLGTTMDVIIYEGILRKGDSLIIGGIDEPIVTKVKALFEPGELYEMRDKKSKFRSVEQVRAATGVKISAPDIENVIAGMPLQSFKPGEIERAKSEIQKEVKNVLIETEKEGIIIKADTLGSIEALTLLLKEKNISVRKTGIGKITSKDVSDAETNYDKDPLMSVILGFNVGSDSDVSSTEKVKIITNNIIYKLLEDYETWKEQTRAILEARKLDFLIRPCKIQLLQNYIFRQSNPAIIGGEVLEGKVRVGTGLMKTNRVITVVKSIQEEKESINAATKGKQVAFALDNVTIGRQIKGDEILYSYIPEEDFRKLKKLTKYLSQGEILVLKEIASKQAYSLHESLLSGLCLLLPL